MRWPHLRHRRVVLGELVVLLCELARRSPAPMRPRVCVRRWAVGGTAYPSLRGMC